jgi:Holliday junction resolvase
MSFRRAAKVDDNQSDIVRLFRKLGWRVLIISQLKNCCDIIVSKAGRTIAVEIKDGKKPPSDRKLSDGEVEFRDNWQGEYALVICDDDVLALQNSQS